MDPTFDLPLIAVRAIHFASTVSLSGIFLFLCCVAEPAFGAAPIVGRSPFGAYRRRLLAAGWWSLALSVLSAGLWWLLLSADVAGSSIAAALADGTARTMLTSTQFGRDWETRLGLAAAVGLAGIKLGRDDRIQSAAGLTVAALAALLLAALAWAGHAGAAPGWRGYTLLMADGLHLVAAGAWIGGLVPLALLLSAARTAATAESLRVARNATLRFSTVGVAAVSTLAVTGALNTWAQLGGWADFVDTLYGRILLLKTVIFVAMVAVAAVNRLRLTPRLVASDRLTDASEALHQLRRNCWIEACAGLAILLVVAVLGTIAPSMPMPAHEHEM